MSTISPMATVYQLRAPRFAAVDVPLAPAGAAVVTGDDHLIVAVLTTDEEVGPPGRPAVVEHVRKPAAKAPQRLQHAPAGHGPNGTPSAGTVLAVQAALRREDA